MLFVGRHSVGAPLLRGDLTKGAPAEGRPYKTIGNG